MRRRSISKQIRAQILARDGYKCRMCGRPSSEVPLEVDHITPVAKGGTDELANLAALCRDCNAGKSDYTFSDYTSMNLLPPDIEQHFKFFHDSKTGNHETYHLYLYLYFRQPGGTLSSHDQYHHSWKITGTERATSSDQVALEARRRAEETEAFKEQIRRSLASERKRLVINEEGVVKI